MLGYYPAFASATPLLDRGLQKTPNHRNCKYRSKWRASYTSSSSIDKPRLLVLPGMDGTELLLRDFQNAASSSDDLGRVIGVNYPLQESLTVAQLAEYVTHNYLEPLRDDPRGYVLVNQSFSGHVGMYLASQTIPGKLFGQVFVNSFVSPPAPRFLRDIPMEVTDRLFRNQPPAWLTGSIFLGPNSSGMGTVREAGSRVLPSVMSSRLAICLQEDSWHIWRNPDLIIGHNTLYLRGDGDVIVRDPDASVMKAARPDIKWIHIESGPHLLLQRYGSKCGVAVRKFCHSLSATETRR